MPDRITEIIEKISGYSILGLVFFLPFSKSGVEIFAAIAISAWLFGKAIRYRSDLGKYFPRTRLNIALAAFFAVSVASSFLSVNMGLSIKSLFSKTIEYILIFMVCVDTFSGNRRAGRNTGLLLTVFMFSAGCLFLDAFYQIMAGKDLVRGFTSETVSASFSCQNGLAGYIAAVLPVLFCLPFSISEKTSRKMKFVVYSGAAVLFFSGLILLGKTLSRGGWAGYMASFIFLAVSAGIYLKKQRVLIVGSLAAIVVPVIVVLLGLKVLLFVKMRFLNPSGHFSIVSRLYQWGEAISIIRDFPVFGAGLNSYTMIIPKYSISNVTGCYTHNCFLQLAAETGLLGLWAFLWIFWRFLKQGLAAAGRVVKDDRAGARACMSLGIMSGVVAILTQSFFDTNLFSLQLAMLFWVMLAVGTAISPEPEEHGHKQREL